ncbi:hypothetical protein HPB50_009895 [Hyalomma asiaticum]|uniref:Uncharacterized protein n=1 Tax=Hyalomma asiaticum TaxID=266040 RepID=A0ACB7RKH1_HYAAI|nr:hypothetical protein HPB50_009895 [Hyalomma asiaticum]
MAGHAVRLQLAAIPREDPPGKDACASGFLAAHPTWESKWRPGSVQVDVRRLQRTAAVDAALLIPICSAVSGGAFKYVNLVNRPAGENWFAPSSESLHRRHMRRPSGSRDAAEKTRRRRHARVRIVYPRPLLEALFIFFRASSGRGKPSGRYNVSGH